MPDETLGGIGVPANVVRFGVVTGQETETHGKIGVPHKVLAALFKTVEGDAQRKKDEDYPIFGDRAVVDHSCRQMTKSGKRTTGNGREIPV